MNKIRHICSLREINFNLPKVVFFSSDGTGNFSGNAMPKFIPDSNFPIIRLFNDVSFIPVTYLKHGQNSQNIKLVLWGVPKLILVSVRQKNFSICGWPILKWWQLCNSLILPFTYSRTNRAGSKGIAEGYNFFMI